MTTRPPTKHLVHSIAQCADCDFYEDDYRVAEGRAAEHAKRTGHEVRIEFGYSSTYARRVRPKPKE